MSIIDDQSIYTVKNNTYNCFLQESNRTFCWPKRSGSFTCTATGLHQLYMHQMKKDYLL